MDNVFDIRLFSQFNIMKKIQDNKIDFHFESWHRKLNVVFFIAINKNVLKDIKNPLRMIIWIQIIYKISLASL